MTYQIFLAEDWVDVKHGEAVDSPWGTKALLYELFDGSGGYTLHWRCVEVAVKPEKPSPNPELHFLKKKTA
jgi:hypothetical protein